MTLNDFKKSLPLILNGWFSNKATLDKISTSEEGTFLFDGEEIKGGGDITNNITTESYTIEGYDKYSEEEEVIGKWIDGKPLYRRTIKLSIQSLMSTTTLVNHVSDWHFERFITLRLITTGNGTLNQEGNDGFHGVTRYVASSDSIIHVPFGEYGNITSAFLITEYTKTTDAENSFTPEMLTNNITIEGGGAPEIAIGDEAPGGDETFWIDTSMEAPVIPGGGSTDTPVVTDAAIGHIIAHMGKTAPVHYLVCDGTVYNIDDYKELAEFINREFGSYNYFGGDGETTFAVPDLRGEFLRGSGTNSHAGQGNGSEVGIHQNATEIPKVSAYNSSGSAGNIVVELSTTASGTWGNVAGNPDFNIIHRPNARVARATGNLNNSTYNNTNPDAFTARPTNTSVLYCIKYEASYFVEIKAENNYSEDEQVIGKWIDGKPIYRKVFYFAQTLTSANRWVTIPVGDLYKEISYVINFTGISNATSGYKSVMVPFHVRVAELGMDIYNASGADINIAIIEYTKITD